jgi:4-hydroxythreonine-4-phosphate dehydrogenase
LKPDAVKKPKIGIVMGDPAGIGPEVSLKCIAFPEVYQFCYPVLIGDCGLLMSLSKQMGLDVNLARYNRSNENMTMKPLTAEVYDIGMDSTAIKPGQVNRNAGEIMIKAIELAVDELRNGNLDGIAIAPLTKEGLAFARPQYHSESDLIADLAGIRTKLVTKWKSIFRATVTGHIAFREIIEQLTKSGIVETAQILQQTMLQFKVQQPRLAIAALNPHAGEGGLFGDEEETLISPAIEFLRDSEVDVKGPIPADTVFVRAVKGEFDGVVFLYHDQGNIAMKAVAFGQGVVIYARMPWVIVTPGHGSAYDIAGQGVADAANMAEAVNTAALLAG